MPYVATEEANNRMIDYIADIKARNGPPPWRERVMATERFRMVLLCWPPGHNFPKHWHPNADESWIICEGQVKVRFDEGPEMTAGPGALIFARKGVTHDMTVVGKEPLLMIAIVTPNEPNDELRSKD